MSGIEKYGLYLASWEHLYLGTGACRGLPNHVFSHHPWVLILFENIYCDEQGLAGEINMYRALQWTNSKLFNLLAYPGEGIIQPLPMQAILSVGSSQLRMEDGSKTAARYQQRMAGLDDRKLLELKLRLLQPFIEEHRLILYDWPIARFENYVPLSLRESIQDVLSLRCPDLFLTLRMSELSPARRALFDDLQRFERDILANLRRGEVDQEKDYIPYLAARYRDYREIDIALSDGLDKRLEGILKVRDRFSRRGGWELVRRYFDAYYSPVRVDPAELGSMAKKIGDVVDRCFLPTLSEIGKGLWHISKAMAGLLPYLGEILGAMELSRSLLEAKSLFRETVTFYRGQSRKRREK